MKVGFIGVGTMGRPMAGHLIDGGHELWVHDLAPVPQALLGKGAKACASGKEAARPPTSSSPWCRTRRTSSRCCSARTAWPGPDARARSWST